MKATLAVRFRVPLSVRPGKLQLRHPRLEVLDVVSEGIGLGCGVDEGAPKPS